MAKDIGDEWIVYMIRTQSGKLYTGITKDLERRFREHQMKQKGARFFNFSKPKSIVFQESLPNRSEATKRECEIKRMRHDEKMKLLNSSKEN